MTHIKWKRVGDGYESANPYTYYSPRFNRSVTVPEKLYSDGATGAKDVKSDAWGVHDVICRYGKWDDGTLIDNFTASTVLGDILWRDGFWFRSIYWWFATYLLGGGAARDNGMWRINASRKR